MKEMLQIKSMGPTFFMRCCMYNFVKGVNYQWRKYLQELISVDYLWKKFKNCKNQNPQKFCDARQKPTLDIVSSTLLSVLAFSNSKNLQCFSLKTQYKLLCFLHITKDQVLARMHFALCSIENNKKLSSVVNTESLINS